MPKKMPKKPLAKKRAGKADDVREKINDKDERAEWLDMIATEMPV